MKTTFGAIDVVADLEGRAAVHKEAANRLFNLSQALAQLVDVADRNGFVTGVSLGDDGVVDVYVHLGSGTEAKAVASAPVMVSEPQVTAFFKRAPQVSGDADLTPEVEPVAAPEQPMPAPELEESAAFAPEETLPPAAEEAPVAAPKPELETYPLPPKSAWPVDRSKRSKKSKADAAKKAAARADAPGLVTDPFTPEDDAYLIEKTLAGDQPATIAQALSRKVKQVANRKQRLKAEIDAARKAASEKRRAAKRTNAPAEKKPDNSQIAQHIANLPPAEGWTPSRDRKLVQYIVDGAGVAGAGAILRVNSEAANARYITLTAGLGVQVSERGRAELLAVLIERDGDPE